MGKSNQSRVKIIKQIVLSMCKDNELKILQTIASTCKIINHTLKLDSSILEPV